MTSPRTRTRNIRKPEQPATSLTAVSRLVGDGVPHIYTAILGVMRDAGVVGKDSLNVQQNFRFRGVDTVVNALAEHLRRHGIITIPRLQTYTYSQVNIGTNRTLTGHAVVEVSYLFASAVDGSSTEVTVPGEAMDVGDKAVSKAMSVAYRTALIQLFNLPTGEVDPDHGVYERSPDEACRVPNDSEPRQQPSRRNGSQRQAKPQPPTSDQLSRWEGQIWEVGLKDLVPLAWEVNAAGAMRMPVPDKDGRIMIQEFVDRFLCIAGSKDIETTDQLRVVWHAAGNAGVIDEPTAVNGATLRETLASIGDGLHKEQLQQAASTEHGQQAVATATASWDPGPDPTADTPPDADPA